MAGNFGSLSFFFYTKELDGKTEAWRPNKTRRVDKRFKIRYITCMKAFNAAGTVFEGQFVPAKGPGRPSFHYVETDDKGNVKILRFGGLGRNVKLNSHKKLRVSRRQFDTPRGAYLRIVKGRK
jgi:hypothetical protein